MPKLFRLKKNYNHILKINDEVSKKLFKLYSKGIWYLDSTNQNDGFTLKDKFDNGKKTFIGDYGGSSSWTERLFEFDLEDTSLYTGKSISLKTFVDGGYQEQNKCSDVQYSNLVRFITNNFYPDRKDDDNIIWIVQNNRDVIANLLEYRIDRKQSVSTFNNDIKIITRIIKILSDMHADVNEFKELYHRTSQLQTDMNMILIERETGKNTLNRYENIINFEELLRIRDRMEDEWRTQLDKNGFKNKSVWEMHYKMLLLSAYTLTPCVRKELMGTMFAITEDEMSDNNDYVFVPPLRGAVEYNFRICKKGKPAERYTVGYNEDVRNKLSDLFRESLEIYKREYVFPKLKNMKEKTSIDNVANILRNLIKGHTIGVNMLRSSYITWRNLNNVSYNEMKDDAIRLRNSVETQQKDYRKMIGTGLVLPVQNLEANKMVLRNGIDNLEKLKTYHKNYYMAHKDRVKEKQREYIENNRDILKAKQHVRLANGSDKQPSKKMIERYQLYQDTNGQWNSRIIYL